MGAKKARNKERFQEKLMSWRPALVNLAVHLWGAGMRRKSLIFKNTDSVSPLFFFFSTWKWGLEKEPLKEKGNSHYENRMAGHMSETCTNQRVILKPSYSQDAAGRLKMWVSTW